MIYGTLCQVQTRRGSNPICQQHLQVKFSAIVGNGSVTNTDDSDRTGDLNETRDIFLLYCKIP